MKCVPSSGYNSCNDLCHKDPRCRRWSYNPWKENLCVIQRKESDRGIHFPKESRFCNKMTGFRKMNTVPCGVNGKRIIF